MTFSPRAIEAAARAIIKARQEWADREGPFGVYYLPYCGVGQHAVRDFRPGAEAKIVARFDTHEEAMTECALLTEQHFLTAALAVDGVAQQGWQQIESAPVEQPVDILCQDTEGERHRFCDATIIDREPHAFTFEDTNGKHTYHPHENGMWPTHWMPIPQPPAASDREERRPSPKEKP